VRQLATRVIVLRDGQVCESGPTADVFRNPANDYTRLLIDAATRGYANLPDPAPEPVPA
jgi:ABC-type microcin C transport system duplicated ATPase subunit YejF